jgi:hypothetical protein
MSGDRFFVTKIGLSIAVQGVLRHACRSAGALPAMGSAIPAQHLYRRSLQIPRAVLLIMSPYMTMSTSFREGQRVVHLAWAWDLCVMTVRWVTMEHRRNSTQGDVV